MATADPNWAEILTAVSTAVGAVGLLSAICAALFAAARQVRESNSVQAFVLYRELDYFEQLAALEHVGAFDFELIRLLLGRRLIDRWEMWKPAINWMDDSTGDDVYPMFGALVARMRRTLAVSGAAAS